MPKKKEHTGTCKLCLKENVKLTKAHLISKTLLRFLNKQNLQYSVDGSDKVSPLGEGWFHYILCQECNGETLSQNEAVLKKFLEIHRNPYDKDLPSKLKGLHDKCKLTPEELYAHIAKAILSFFWQLQTAQLIKDGNCKLPKFFKHEITPEALEEIRLLILTKNIKKSEDFPINIAYCVPKKRLQTFSDQENSTFEYKICIDIFLFKLILLGPNQTTPEKVLSPENYLQPFDDSAFFLGDMRNAILNEFDIPFINNLYERGKNDLQEFSSTPAHPIRILKELIAIAPGRHEKHYQSIIDALLELSKNPSNIAQSKYSPLDVLKEFLSSNMWCLFDHIDSDTRLENKSAGKLTESQYFSLRKEIFEFSVSHLLLSENKTSSYKGADFILDYIIYVENDLPPVLQQYYKEAYNLFSKIKTTLEQKKLSVPAITVLYIKIECILKYAEEKDTKTVELVCTIRDLIEEHLNGLDEKIIYLLVRRHNASKIHPNVDKSIDAKTAQEIGEELFAAYPTAREQTKYLETLHIQIKDSVSDFNTKHLDWFCSEVGATPGKGKYPLGTA